MVCIKTLIKKLFFHHYILSTLKNEKFSFFKIYYETEERPLKYEYETLKLWNYPEE